ncbi:phosphoenolpyruvate-dependent sugar phosphotransferase system, EIIA 2 [Clostridiales bacterium 1_7_47FAA]|uniref:PTS sugar transporter subunit IIA n=1 Tax=Enterocloster hominis (ex Hitch et al. 2024) TaxID=1917870 RepID=A0ABV1D3V7_9FIRM|nr:PTS sugar transporter subunit IIA [Lachnoclostridium pacaense]EEQ56367.1 phosphoenolpyruvate-dependent sugar phosphotransferase system, EIIA 2 [Clostridiales bacterium 1_7_47FAA]MCC2820203.1 PTS sugar transporter subunit IIA [Lachnoclostridium pacaense]
MENIFVIDGTANSWEDAIRLCSDELIRKGAVKTTFREACLKREESFPTGLPTNPGVAIPHAGNEHVLKNAICLLRLDNPVLFQRLDAPDETVEVNLVFNLATSESDGHIEVLKKLMKFIHDGAELRRYMDATLEQLHDRILEHLNE